MHVGTNIGSKIDANFEKAIFKKLMKNKRVFNDFSSCGVRTWHQKSIKSRFLAENAVPEATLVATFDIFLLCVCHFFGRF